MNKNTCKCDGHKDALTKANLLIKLKREEPFSDLKPKELEATLTRTCQIVSPKGFRDRVKYELDGGQAVFIKLKPSQFHSGLDCAE